jgi:hypothetical protein
VESHPRFGLTCFAAFIAISAFGGAVGLVTGSLDLGPELNERLPFDSPVIAAAALAVVVGIPSTVVMIRSWRGDTGTAAAARVAGWLLIAWIAIEIAFIHEFSILQAVYAVAGVVYVVLGRSPRPALPTKL